MGAIWKGLCWWFELHNCNTYRVKNMQVGTFLVNEIVKLNSFSWGLNGPSLRPPEGKPLLSSVLYSISHSPFYHSEHWHFKKESEMKCIKLKIDLTCNEMANCWLKNCLTEQLGQLNLIQLFNKWAEICINIKNLMTKQKYQGNHFHLLIVI